MKLTLLFLAFSLLSPLYVILLILFKIDVPLKSFLEQNDELIFAFVLSKFARVEKFAELFRESKILKNPNIFYCQIQKKILFQELYL